MPTAYMYVLTVVRTFDDQSILSIPNTCCKRGVSIHNSSHFPPSFLFQPLISGLVPVLLYLVLMGPYGRVKQLVYLNFRTRKKDRKCINFQIDTSQEQKRYFFPFPSVSVSLTRFSMMWMDGGEGQEEDPFWTPEIFPSSSIFGKKASLVLYGIWEMGKKGPLFRIFPIYPVSVRQNSGDGVGIK